MINESTVVSDADAKLAVAALQIQISRDFAPIWNLDATLTFFSSADRGKLPATSWWMAVLDNSDTAGALGYHDITPTGLPLSKVFAKSDLTAKQSWSVTMSHELCEMLADPNVNLVVFAQDSNTSGILYALETADACESDSYAYVINGIKVSDFVTPAWFEDWRAPNSAKFDFCGQITQPLQLLPGGYIGTFNATGGGWTQKLLDQDQGNPHLRPKIGSRFERRAVARSRWMASTA